MDDQGQIGLYRKLLRHVQGLLRITVDARVDADFRAENLVWVGLCRLQKGLLLEVVKGGQLSVGNSVNADI